MLPPVIILVALFLPGIAGGEDSRLNDENEINHLLQFVERSDCTFVRNDVKYDGERARKHLERKYNFIKKRSKQVSAELFIEYAASKSSLSKKPYFVECGARTITSEQWLLGELERNRRSP